MVKLGKKAIFGIIAAAALAAGAILVLFRPEHVEEILPVVGIDTVRTRNVEIYGEFPGKIRAQQFVEVRARVEGYLEDMMFAEGTYVKKDQVLFIIDPKQYKAQVDRAEALVTKNKAIALKAERDLARIRPLYEQKAASQLDLDNAIAAYESAKADVQVNTNCLTELRLKRYEIRLLYRQAGLFDCHIHHNRTCRFYRTDSASGRPVSENRSACGKSFSFLSGREFPDRVSGGRYTYRAVAQRNSGYALHGTRAISRWNWNFLWELHLSAPDKLPTGRWHSSCVSMMWIMC